jgi:hypothetical protein
VKKPPDMRELGRRGGRKRSAAKTAAARLNAARAREAAAAKRGTGLPPFDEGEPFPAEAEPSGHQPDNLPSLESKAATLKEIGITGDRRSNLQPVSLKLEELGISKPQSSDIPNKLEDAQPKPNGNRWPPWPDPPRVRTEFELRVRATHQFFNPGCSCSFCA